MKLRTEGKLLFRNKKKCLKLANALVFVTWNFVTCNLKFISLWHFDDFTGVCFYCFTSLSSKEYLLLIWLCPCGTQDYLYYQEFVKKEHFNCLFHQSSSRKLCTSEIIVMWHSDYTLLYRGLSKEKSWLRFSPVFVLRNCYSWSLNLHISPVFVMGNCVRLIFMSFCTQTTLLYSTCTCTCMSKGQFKFPVSPVFFIGNCVILKFMCSYTQTTWLYSMSKEKFKFCVSPVFSIGNCVTLKFMSFSTWTGSCGTLKSMSFYTQTTWLYSTCTCQKESLHFLFY